jgi:hypothetical protein
MEQIYPRHLSSFPLFGIEAHGFWTAKEEVEPRLFVLASYYYCVINVDADNRDIWVKRVRGGLRSVGAGW